MEFGQDFKAFDECSVRSCRNKCNEGDKLFCGLHRISWRNMVEPFGMLAENDLDFLLENFKKGLGVVRK